MKGLTLTRGPMDGLVLLEPACHTDARGHFLEVWRHDRYPAATFVQDNLSRSARGVLRGLHYQLGAPQAKLITAVRGAVFDVAVDLRRGSATFGRWFGTVLSDENHRQLFVPEGFAHGFLVLSDQADVWYKVTATHHPAGERVLRWDDPDVAIAWPLEGAAPVLSARDAAAPALAAAEVFP